MTARGSTPPDACPDENALDGYAAGRLAPGERASIKAHLIQCELCQVIVAALVRSSAPSAPRSLEHLPGILESDEMTLPQGMRVGRFSILERIGAGGMGVVYSAYDAELQRRVALKFLRSAWSPVAQTIGRQRLLHEAQSMARLTHPHVVAVFDVGTFGDGVYLAMEFVEGRTLRACCAERARTSAEILDVFTQAALGLSAAHEVGVVHRDFKPDNVLIGWDGRAQVTDFGLARRMDAPHAGGSASAHLPQQDWAGSQMSDGPPGGALSAESARAGTPRYMAPEQIEGGAIDARTDQFGFCVALYEALSGRLPFAGADPAARLAAIRAGDIAPLAPSRGVSPRVEAAIRRGLQADPDARFPSMTALCRQLAPAPARRRWLGAAAFGAAMVAGALVWALMPEDAIGTCAREASDLARVWTRDRGDLLEGTLRSLGAPSVAGAARVALDDYAAGWSRAALEVCRETRVLHSQSFVRFERRRACLALRRLRFEAMVDALSTLAGDVSERSLEAIRELPSPLQCGDTEWLPKFAASEESVVSRVASAHALASLGLSRQALAQARGAVVPEAGEVGLEAALLVMELTDDSTQAARLGRRILEVAERARLDRIAALAAAQLATLSDADLEGSLWRRYATAAAERAGAGPSLHGLLRAVRSRMEHRR